MYKRLGHLRSGSRAEDAAADALASVAVGTGETAVQDDLGDLTAICGLQVVIEGVVAFLVEGIDKGIFHKSII